MKLEKALSKHRASYSHCALLINVSRSPFLEPELTDLAPAELLKAPTAATSAETPASAAFVDEYSEVEEKLSADAENSHSAFGRAAS